MRRFVTLDCLVDSNDINTFSYNNVRSLRQALLSHVTYQPRIQQALQHTNFHFHRTCSYGNILRECHVGEGRTLLMYWRPAHSESGVTVSMSASSCSSIIPNPHADRELRSAAQQTDITCRYIAGMGTPGVAVSAKRSEQCNRQLSFRQHLPHLLRRCVSGAPGAAVRLPRDYRCCSPFLSRAVVTTSRYQLLRAMQTPLRGHQESQMVLDAFSYRMGALGTRARAGGGRVARGGAGGGERVRHGARAARGRPRAAGGRARRRPAALAANLFSSLLIGIIGALNGLLTTWILLKIQEHQMSWQAWRDSTLHVRVLLADDETMDDEERLLPTDDPPTIDRSTNVADPFMVAMPFALPDS
ncbi:uncharacterized protein LOC125230514 isoform X2 [Leguminivora glycinivorella]|uniref:uncharacterized protein LOC125230514 isoform X2 n=1 Tax=Leguminivora glycinivorella TaxID=1035111 RepID=UPI00200F9B32|nr:uncharacterized protein LOC125230514 isoform X2 [Leguminivora glycinivorella]